MKTTFIKLNDLPVEIECIVDEHDDSRDFTPSFWFNNHRYYLDDFIRTHNNPWCCFDDMPEYIHGMEADNYCNPLWIEVLDEEHINVYQEIEV